MKNIKNEALGESCDFDYENIHSHCTNYLVIVFHFTMAVRFRIEIEYNKIAILIFSRLFESLKRSELIEKFKLLFPFTL